MEKFNLYQAFIYELQDRFPQKSILVNSLADLLIMEKESIYRRLRGDVPFTLSETGIIAKTYNISLDNLIFNGDNPNNSIFQFNWVSYEDFENPDYNAMVEMLDYVKMLLKEPDSECGFSLNCFDNIFFSLYNSLTRFLHFKKVYRHGKDTYIHYEDITHKDHYSRLMKEIYLTVSKFNKITYIWDMNLIGNLVNEIKYFENIGLIERESIEIIKSDLKSYLSSIEKSAFAGRFADKENNFELYIAEISISQTCYYIGNSDHFWSALNTFELQSCTSIQPINYQGIKKWINALKGLSTQISGAGEKERIKFFNAQKTIVENL